MSKPHDPLRILTELTRNLSSEEPMEHSLKAVVEAAMQVVPASHSSIRLFDETGTRLLSGARSGAGSEHEPVSFRPGEGIVGWVAERGQVVCIDDTENDSRFVEKPGQGFSVRSIIAVPLWSAGRVVGVLAVTSPEATTFSDDDAILIQLLANCAVPPIERTRQKILAVTDPQTRAYSQRYLFPRLREEINRARQNATPLSVLLMDLDELKKVNDQFGHSAGDSVLSDFANRVRTTVRLHDVLVRRGGEEFVLVMPMTNLDQAKAVAERIHRRVAEEAFTVAEGQSVAITVTIGLAAWNHRETAEELELRADLAMFEGKRLGRNRVVAAPSQEQANATPEE